MHDAVIAILKKARPKFQALMRTSGFYTLVDMMLQYKTHILGILESNVGGIYHATSTVLKPLDRVQTAFVHNFNLDIEEAFLKYNLAPLCLRRALLPGSTKIVVAHENPHRVSRVS